MAINKYKLADHMRNSMHIPDEYLNGLTIYKMQHFPAPQFKQLLDNGQIDSNNIMFNVIYHQCTPVRAKKAQEVRMSFRAAKPEYGIEPYVLVQVVID